MSFIDIDVIIMAAKFGVFVDEDHSKHPTSYRLLQLHKYPISHVYC